MHASKPSLPRIRLATEDDAAGVLAVYAPYVSTPVTFEEAVPALDEFRVRMAAAQADYPYLVAVINDDAPLCGADEGERACGKAPARKANRATDGQAVPEGSPRERVAGFAYAHAQHERAAYAWNAELSVYLVPEAHGRGLGGTLYATLIDLLRLQGVQAAYALVTVPNKASEHLHGAFGFELMGLQRNAGYTCGAWHDVAWLVKRLGAFEAHPAPIVPFPTLTTAHPDAVRAALDRANAEIAERAGRARALSHKAEA